MFGLEFQFAAAFLALPLVGLPVLLHMLFRRRSPVVLFSTLRFIKASMQQTAARRRIQRWILLACRMLLLLLLIWAISRPVLILATGWFDSKQSIVAAIVVDTSYSMQLKEQQVRLIDRANDIVLELLREPLRNGRVAIFRSTPPAADQPERLQTAAEIQSQWRPLESGPSPKPLAERVLAAAELLSRQQADQKWLIVLTDLQSREFPAPLPPLENTRVVMFDLHPNRPASFGVTQLAMEPQQPIPGVGTTALLEFAGRANETCFSNLNLLKLNGENLRTIPTQQAALESAGRARVRVELRDGLPAERWVLVQAQLQKEDDMAWDNQRSLLAELPPRQSVTFIAAPGQPEASAFIRLALDPWEGKMPSWPLAVTAANDLTGKEQVAVMALSAWPDVVQAGRLVKFVRAGGTLIMLLQPGMEQMWTHQGEKQKAALAQLLPAAIAPTLPGGGSAGASGTYRPVPPSRVDAVLEGLTDPSFRLDLLAVRRFVPFGSVEDPSTSTLLHLSPAGEARGASGFGLVYRRAVGNGTVFTVTTLPEGRYISPPAHPLFLPMLVSMSLRPPEQRDAQNVEIGRPLILAGHRFAGVKRMQIDTPSNARHVVEAEAGAEEPRFTFAQAREPGLYYWRKAGEDAVVAVANVQLPAAESDLVYKEAAGLVGEDREAVVARSFADFRASVAKINEPQPKWTVPLAIVLLLICAEALLASLSQLWKPWSLKKALWGEGERRIHHGGTEAQK